MLSIYFLAIVIASAQSALLREPVQADRRARRLRSRGAARQRRHINYHRPRQRDSMQSLPQLSSISIMHDVTMRGLLHQGCLRHFGRKEENNVVRDYREAASGSPARQAASHFPHGEITYGRCATCTPTAAAGAFGRLRAHARNLPLFHCRSIRLAPEPGDSCQHTHSAAQVDGYRCRRDGMRGGIMQYRLVIGEPASGASAIFVGIVARCTLDGQICDDARFQQVANISNTSSWRHIIILFEARRNGPGRKAAI